MFRFTIRDVLWLMVLVAGCNQQPRGNLAPNPEFDAQVEIFDRQTKEQDRLLADQEKAMKLADELMMKQNQQTQRMDKLLDTLEEQAKRKDTILDAEERQLGIKK